MQQVSLYISFIGSMYFLIFKSMNHLFVYGTLLQSGNQFGLYLKNNSTVICPGQFPGKLFNIGGYPGAIYEPEARSAVFGSVLLLNNAAEALRIMDDYEGTGDSYPQPNEFIRKVIDINTDSVPIKCWVYLYNLPVYELPEIKKGDYIDFLTEGE